MKPHKYLQIPFLVLRSSRRSQGRLALRSSRQSHGHLALHFLIRYFPHQPRYIWVLHQVLRNHSNNIHH